MQPSLELEVALGREGADWAPPSPSCSMVCQFWSPNILIYQVEIVRLNWIRKTHHEHAPYTRGCERFIKEPDPVPADKELQVSMIWKVLALESPWESKTTFMILWLKHFRQFSICQVRSLIFKKLEI